jgi:hypothetical protein
MEESTNASTNGARSTTFKTFFLIIICVVFGRSEVRCEIKNGYGININSIKRSLAGLLQLRMNSEKLSPSKKRGLDSSITTHRNFISYYNLTDALLRYYKMIDPELFNSIDTIHDANGFETDVFVKFIPREQATVQAAGATSIGLSKIVQDTYISEYGEKSVSIIIWNVPNALTVLAHEFGHVKYQVPNLKSYYSFYRKSYIARTCDPNFLGHDPLDPSGKVAYQSERRFRDVYYHYIKDGNDPVNSPEILLMSMQNTDSLDVSELLVDIN